MKGISLYLLEWTEQYFKSKDIIAKSIEKIEKKDHEMHVKYKHKEIIVLAMPELENFKGIEKFNENEHITIITVNSEKNIKKLIEHWNSLIKHRFLSLYFVNPFSNTDKRWIVYPNTHSRIADEQSLKQGIKALSETVEYIDLEEFESRIQGG